MSRRTLIELLYGKGAHANPITALQGIPAELAARKLEGYSHSISQIVGHMNYWMDYELRRIRQEHSAYPAHAADSWPSDSSVTNEAEWNAEVARFAALLEKLSALAQSDPEFLNHKVRATHEVHKQHSSSVLAVLWQIAAHNSYHVGQVVLLRRLLNNWPCEVGDSW